MDPIDRLADIESGKTKSPEKTIAWYWLKNAGDGSHFAKKGVVFECFHNFVALSQWGNSIFGIMSPLIPKMVAIRLYKHRFRRR